MHTFVHFDEPVRLAAFCSCLFCGVVCGTVVGDLALVVTNCLAGFFAREYHCCDLLLQGDAANKVPAEADAAFKEIHSLCDPLQPHVGDKKFTVPARCVVSGSCQ